MEPIEIIGVLASVGYTAIISWTAYQFAKPVKTKRNN
jgi:hypothetical protein